MIDDSIPYEHALSLRADDLTTACVHAGDTPDPSTASLDPPIVLSNAFAFASAEEAAGAFRGENDAYIYGRWSNPTVESLERKLAALEGAGAACATASGMAAITGALLATCGEGDHVIAPRSMYAESARLLRERLPRLGIRTTFVDASRPSAYAEAMTPATRVLYLETPSNPTLALTDVAAVAAIARAASAADGARRVLTIADGTFATPFCQTPLALGADLVVHSMTKALGGHGDAIGGAVCGTPEDVERVRDWIVKGMGGVLSPSNAFLVARGLRTFALRQRQACETAARLARALEEHPAVARVFHPSLPSHEGHALARRQMHAYGSLLSFEVRAPSSSSGGSGGDAVARGRRVLEGVRVMRHAVSLGDVKTLVTHPASTTHSTMPAETRRLAGIGDGLLRVSVGIESFTALWRDLEGALGAS